MLPMPPFQGFNRAHAAIIEAAILVSRLHLHMLAREKVEQEITYREIGAWKYQSARPPLQPKKRFGHGCKAFNVAAD
jgi:hypothetical protein